MALMIKNDRIAVVIPALNEALTIASVVKGAIAQGCHVYVVDDNSADETAVVALNAGATVLRLPYTAGAWMAVQAGLLYAVKSGSYDFVITLDADGQHDPGFIPHLVKACENSDANVLVGSFPERGSAARQLAWSLFSFLTRLQLHDMTSGFRLYDRKAVDVLLTKEAALLDYQDLGVLLMLRRYGLSCEEIPVVMRDRAAGHSRIFDSWFEVGCYMAKTLLWIMADWVSDSRCRRSGWEKYDIF